MLLPGYCNGINGKHKLVKSLPVLSCGGLYDEILCQSGF